MAGMVQSLPSRHVRFNAYEVLEIAEQIKCNAALFYYKSVDLFPDAEIRSLLLELVERQTKCGKIFADMRKQLSKSCREVGTCGFEYDTLPNVRAMASLTAFAVKAYPSPWRLTGHENKQQILEKAVLSESDIIIFFHGLKEGFARDKTAREQIDRIFKKERSLINFLRQYPKESSFGKSSALVPISSVR